MNLIGMPLDRKRKILEGESLDKLLIRTVLAFLK
jgi:hypothetical protein